MADFEIKIADGTAQIYSPYNNSFVRRMKLLGARWNAADKCWEIAERAVPEARTLMYKVYGRDDTPVGETVDCELTFGERVIASRAPITILGRTIAVAYGRDSGARIGDDVMFIEGAPESGGSMRRWTTEIPSGCIVHLLEIPKAAVFNAKLPDGVSMSVLGGNTNRKALLLERQKLVARIREIDTILKS